MFIRNIYPGVSSAGGVERAGRAVTVDVSRMGSHRVETNPGDHSRKPTQPLGQAAAQDAFKNLTYRGLMYEIQYSVQKSMQG